MIRPFSRKAGANKSGAKRRTRRSGEWGRSMVEILGVLAIMGVLAMTGLWIFRYAMHRYYANEIINGVQARSVIIGQQRVLEHALDLSEFHPGEDRDLILGRFEISTIWSKEIVKSHRTRNLKP